MSNNYVLNENKQIPKAPNLPQNRVDDMREFFEDVMFLTSFSGCSIFEAVKDSNEQHTFYAKGRGSDAKGVYTTSGFTVLKGSVVAKGITKSFSWGEKRNKLVNEYCIMHNNSFILDSDKTFSSPSTAADFCLGRSNNGWTTWKDQEGQTLDSIYRKQI